MTPEIADRIAGGLFGLCVGDALGATCEFLSPAEIARRHGRHTEIIGGGSFGWRPGQGTDDSDMAMVIARAYAEGYSLEAVAKGFVSWYRSNPRDIGGTTATALTKLAHGENPRRSGATHDRSAANGSLMRAV
ncbi:MAG: ADP-ribosylglycohydrolase family protein, partial [Acidimicrobiales bacterium]